MRQDTSLTRHVCQYNGRMSKQKLPQHALDLIAELTIPQLEALRRAAEDRQGELEEIEMADRMQHNLELEIADRQFQLSRF